MRNLSDLADCLERDRREPDKVLCYVADLRRVLDDHDYRVADLKEQVDDLDLCYRAYVDAVKIAVEDCQRGIIGADEIVPEIERMTR